MVLLILFSFLAGIVTVLSPCILPVLPVILSSSIGGKHNGVSRPLGVVTGFILSFTFFTLFLTSIVRLLGIPAEILRTLSVILIAGFGLSLLVPRFQLFTEMLFSRLSGRMKVNGQGSGYGGGLLLGISVGLLWTPCVGPILASVISLAVTGTVTLDSVFITFAYAVGTAIPMFLIILSGRNALQRVPWLLSNSARIQKFFGVVMIATAIGILFNADRTFQMYILKVFPQYGTGLTKLEDNDFIKDELNKRAVSPVDTENTGKPMFDVTESQGALAPELIPGGEWFNSKPLTLKELRGKVVLIDFWTYSCINCQRTLPYLRTWYEKYHDNGLVIIGVHSPEFEFEKNPENVKDAIADFRLTYPVVQDNNFATWRAYNNRYWPAKYVIDKEGRIRYQHFGEGAYDETEEVLRELLKEAGAQQVPQGGSNPTYSINARTPELYLGYGRIESLESPEKIVQDGASRYTAPDTIQPDRFAYEGVWNIMEEYANPQKGSSLVLNFEAQEVYLVMKTKGVPSTVKVYVDGAVQYPGEDTVNGIVTIDSDALYKLIKLPSPGRHILRLEFQDDNAEIFAFTFG